MDKKVETMDKALHGRDDIDSLYVPGNKEEKGLVRIEHSVNPSPQGIY